LKTIQYETFSAVDAGRKQGNITMLEFWACSKGRVVAQFQKKKKNFRVEKFEELKRRGNEV
jgi:hypothetical protein